MDSRLVGNYAAGEGNLSAYGGGAHVASGGMLTILRSRVSAHHASVWSAGHGQAGGIYLAANGALDIRESVIDSNYTSAQYADHPNYGGGLLNNGTLWMQNCLVVSNWSHCNPAHSDGLMLSGGEATVVNCTIADNAGVGIRYGAGVISVTNSILWGHTTSNVYNYPVSGRVFENMSHTLIDGYPFMDGVNGCLVDDPLFDDQQYYHLQSIKGVYRGGYFSGGALGGRSMLSSPGLDAGTNFPFIVSQNEPLPNGRIVNMGAYGGTSVASISLVPVEGCRDHCALRQTAAKERRSVYAGDAPVPHGDAAVAPSARVGVS